MMDFMTHLPQTLRRHDAVWVIVDRLTKSKHFSNSVYDLHTGGILEVVYSRDCPVTWSVSLYHIEQGSQVYDTLLTMGTQLTMSTTFHPQTDGQSKMTIQVLEDMLQA